MGVELAGVGLAELKCRGCRVGGGNELVERLGWLAGGLCLKLSQARRKLGLGRLRLGRHRLPDRALCAIPAQVHRLSIQ
jgi:hypothetical protein